GVRRQYRDNVAADLGKTAIDKQPRDVLAALDAHLADAELADERSPTGQYAEFAVEHWQRHEVGRLVEYRPLGRHYADLHALAVNRRRMCFSHSSPDFDYLPAFIRSACSAASSMAPTYMNAPSGRWSHLPSQISSKERIVSASGVTLPGLFVNASATRNGCDRKRSMRRARFTTCLSSSLNSSMPRIAMMS